MSRATQNGETLEIRRPDDWHVHLRDGAMLELAVAATARQFARAIVMPNLRAAGHDPRGGAPGTGSASWLPVRRGSSSRL